MGRVLIGTAAGLEILQGGAASSSDLLGHSVDALARDGPTTLAVVDGRSVWSDGGGEWGQRASSEDLALRCLAATRAGVLVGTERAHLLLLTDGSLERDQAFDAVEGRDGWYTPWGGPPDTRSLSAGPGGGIHVNVHVGGIVRSLDGGRTWRPTIDVDSDVHQVLAHPTEEATVLAATAFGLAVSRDRGDSWAFRTEGLDHRYCRAVAVAGDSVLVSAARGPRGGDAAVYRGSLDGETLERCRAGLPEGFRHNIDSHTLTAVADRAAFGTRDGDVYVSEDGGGSWERALSGLAEISSVVIAGEG